MSAPNRTEQQASFKALRRFSAKQNGAELRGHRLAVLIAEALTGHAGGERGWEADHLEPSFFVGGSPGFACYTRGSVLPPLQHH